MDEGVSLPREPEAPAKSGAGRSFGKTSLLLPPSLSWTLLLYAALALATAWAYSLQRIRTDREQMLQSESNRLRAVAVALETSASAMISDGVGSAMVRANEIEAAGGLDAVSERDLRPTLGKSIMGGGYVRSIFIVDARRFARGTRTGVYDLERKPPAWFTAITTPGSEVWVGAPMHDPDLPSSPDELVPVAHVLHYPGHPDLWAGGLFDFHAFESFRTELGGPGGVVVLMSLDGALLAITQQPPADVSLGKIYFSSALFQQALHSIRSGWDSGIVTGYGPIEHQDMVYGYGRVRDYPLVVGTGRPLSAILAPWRERVFMTLVVTGAFSALVLAMTLLLSHSLYALRSREVHYRTLFNNTAFSVFISEGDRFLTANDTALRMFGLKDIEAVRNLPPDMLSPLEQPDGQPSSLARRKRIEQATRDGKVSFEWLHKRVDTGELFPAEVDINILNLGKTAMRLAVVHDLTETKRAEQERRESEERYRALVDAMPEAVLVHRGGSLLFGNAAARALVGARPEDKLTGTPVLTFVVEPDREVLEQRTRRILEQGQRAEPREARIRRLDGTVIWVEVQGVRVQYEGAPAVQAVLRDITARKQQEAAEAARILRMQRQSDALLRMASRNSSTGWRGLGAELEGIAADAAQVLGVDRVGIWLLEDEDASLRCAALYERGCARRSEALMLLPTSRVPLYLSALRSQRVIDGASVEGDPRLTEFNEALQPLAGARSIVAAAIRRSGELSGVVSVEQLDAARTWHLDEASFAGGVADQVAQALLDSEREQVLADLQVLAGELMRIQNEERRRIGRDLHDSTGQTLAALELDLARLSEAAQSLAAKPREMLANAVRLARQCSTEIRTASYLLHPPLLDELGLMSALRWLADGLEERSGIEVRLELPESMQRLSPANELTLFRVAQEALTNVQRHSASPWVGIRLTVLESIACLEVEDGGRGISRGARATAAKLGVGLAGMRERIRQVGGTFAVESAAAGTRIRVTVPLKSLGEARSA
jgi:PAS domain S-box-containing protein